MEAVYNAQRYEVDTRNMFLGRLNANFVPGGTTVTLPTGQPNPNVWPAPEDEPFQLQPTAETGRERPDHHVCAL